MGGLASGTEGDEIEVHHVTAANEWALDVGLAARLDVHQSGYLALRDMKPPTPYLHHGSAVARNACGARLQPGPRGDLAADPGVATDEHHVLVAGESGRGLGADARTGRDLAPLVQDGGAHRGAGPHDAVLHQHAVVHRRALLDDHTGTEHAADDLAGDVAAGREQRVAHVAPTPAPGAAGRSGQCEMTGRPGWSKTSTFPASRSRCAWR